MPLSEQAIQRRRIIKIRGHMIDRCTKPHHKYYSYYGGRGITVCRRWLESSQAFVDDMGPRPPGGTLERIKNHLGYSPANCRWATRAEQVRNRRNTIFARVNGVRMCLKDACAALGTSYDAVWRRMKRGSTLAAALAKPVQPRRSPTKGVSQ